MRAIEGGGVRVGMILYLGLLSGLAGGFVWFLLDTLTKLATLGGGVLVQLSQPLTFLFIPLFFYSLAGLVLGLAFSLLQLLLTRGGRSVLWSTLPPHFPLFLLWTATLLLTGWWSWERNHLSVGRPNGPTYLSGLIGLSFLPIYLALVAGRWSWKGSVTRLAALLLFAAPALISGVHLMKQEEESPGASLVEPGRETGGSGEGHTNCLLITIDTLRRDHLGCYGHPAVRTHAIDRLALEGVLFENCVAQAPITLPSHCSILTGTYPPFHGVRDNALFRLDSRFLSLTERLKEGGYTTAAFISAFPLAANFGLDQGFDFYDDDLIDLDAFYFSRMAGAYALAPVMERVGFYRPVTIAERKGEVTVDRVLQWLDAIGRRPFFLWVHLFDPHNPLDPPAAYEAMYAGEELLARVGTQAEREHIRSLRDYSEYSLDSPAIEYMKALYQAEVTYTDDQVGRLLARLEERGLADRTLVVFTADHGQSLSEHGYVGHSGALYAQTIDVPLVLRLPGILPPGTRVEGLVQSVDISPTILELLGLGPSGEGEGRSLAKQMWGGTTGGADRPAYFETLHAGRGEERFRGVTAGGWKFIRSEDGSIKKLYHVAIDPEERIDLSAIEGGRLVRMEALLDSTIGQYGGDAKEERAPLDRGTREMLRTLGYVW